MAGEQAAEAGLGWSGVGGCENDRERVALTVSTADMLLQDDERWMLLQAQERRDALASDQVPT